MPSAEASQVAAERRQLTVMFCDLVESTALSQRLDPEDMREVVRAYQAACAEVIDRFEGHIAQYLGDGLLVYFGYPRAHEDDARRAVQTGLGIVEAVQHLNARLTKGSDARLAVRVGIHTGLVVVGEVGSGLRHEHLALGETPNLAARLQTIAEPDTVTISVTTHRLVERAFACRDLGAHTVKGVSAPLRAYRVLEERAVPAALAATITGVTPLVGRDQEVGLLLDRWEQVRDGLGQVVLLSGEAGIGKSRLLRELRERVATEPHVRWECRCSPYHQDSALYPVIDLFQRILEFGRDEPPEAKLRKIQDGLERYGLADPETVALWAALLAVPRPASHPPLNFTPQRQRRQTLEAVGRLLLALAAQQPVLVSLEDLHWVDPSTLELLNLLVDQAPTARVLLLVTFRPDFRPAWPPRLHVTYLTLGRLTRRQTELMVGRAAGGKRLPAEVAQQVVARTDGVPLFVEELTKMVLESGLLRPHEDRYELTGPLPPLAIPATLQDSLMARLDRLATVKEVAQLGATLGRSFSYDLLAAVSPVDEAALQRALERLVEAELVYRRGVAPEATYIFKHALIQEAAYQSLLKRTRQQYHQRIAHVLEARFPETVETQPELLAHHYTEAGLSGQAVGYWQRAGERAIQRSANVEAIAHLTTGRQVLATLPDAPDRRRQELDLQIALGAPLTAVKGWGAPEVKHAYTRARELCREVGEPSQLARVLYGLWTNYEYGGELLTSQEVAEELLHLAQSVQDPALLLQAHRGLGGTLFWCGAMVPALAHLEQGMAFYDPAKQRSQAFESGHAAGVACLSHAARMLWSLGYPTQALKRNQQALALAHEVAHPASLAYAYTWTAMLHQLRREGPAAGEQAELAAALSSEQGFAQFGAGAVILRGWALADQGQTEQGLAEIHQGLAAWRGTGAELVQPYWLALLAEAYRNGGQATEGLAALAEALALVEKNAEHYYEAELYRLKGDLLLALTLDNQAEAETCFRQAIDAARGQQAKSLELRAVTSRSRLWRRQGKRQEARRTLADVYAWFTEGFDTGDLQEAHALMDELS